MSDTWKRCLTKLNPASAIDVYRISEDGRSNTGTGIAYVPTYFPHAEERSRLIAASPALLAAESLTTSLIDIFLMWIVGIPFQKIPVKTKKANRKLKNMPASMIKSFCQ